MKCFFILSVKEGYSIISPYLRHKTIPKDGESYSHSPIDGHVILIDLLSISNFFLIFY
jgi:hypothetical protein